MEPVVDSTPPVVSPPFPQYDVLLSAPHHTHRTVANAILDSEIRPRYRRSLLVNVDEMMTDLQRALQRHLGDNVPKPKLWLPSTKVVEEGDVIPGSASQFSFGKVGRAQNKIYTVYQASHRYFIEKDHIPGKGRTAKRSRYAGVADTKKQKLVIPQADFGPYSNEGVESFEEESTASAMKETSCRMDTASI